MGFQLNIENKAFVLSAITCFITQKPTSLDRLLNSRVSELVFNKVGILRACTSLLFK